MFSPFLIFLKKKRVIPCKHVFEGNNPVLLSEVVKKVKNYTVVFCEQFFPVSYQSQADYRGLFASMCSTRSSMRFEYPHSLSYQLMIFTEVPSTLVQRPSTIEE